MCSPQQPQRVQIYPQHHFRLLALLQHIVKKCEVKSDLEVLHCITSDMAGARFTPPPHTPMLRGCSVAFASAQNAHKKLPRLFAEARQRECLTR
jgi:hypothetical protein